MVYLSWFTFQNTLPFRAYVCRNKFVFSDFLENEILYFGSYRKFYPFSLTSSLLTG